MPHSWIKRTLKRTPLPWLLRNGVSRRDVIQRCIDAAAADDLLGLRKPYHLGKALASR